MSNRAKRANSKKFDEDEDEALKQQSDFFNEFSDAPNSNVGSGNSLPGKGQDEKKPTTVVQRVRTGVLLFGSFLVLLCMGPFYLSLLVVVVQIGFFREIINLKRNYMRETMIKSTTYLVWAIFILGVVFSSVWNFSELLPLQHSRALAFLVTYRNILFFCVYMTLFLLFVLSLRFGYIRYQLRLFIEAHISLLISAIVGWAQVVIYEGTVWFLAAALAVIANDLFAYVAGLNFGRHKLIDLSPKKTVEGFVGGMIGSIFTLSGVC